VTKALVLAAVLASVVATQAQAITYGQPDENRHPEVGGLVTTSTRTGEQYVYCSGTLISPTVFLTAAHCDIGTSTVCVTFDPQLTSRSRFYCGTFYAHPQYNQSTSPSSSSTGRFAASSPRSCRRSGCSTRCGPPER
jgi:secreted trypsin-like serine protease